jgi:hypothetical protein
MSVTLLLTVKTGMLELKPLKAAPQYLLKTLPFYELGQEPLAGTE